MSENLFIIIEYINDNFRFGSTLGDEKIEELFRKYPIIADEKNIVYKELDSLELKIIGSKRLSEIRNRESDTDINKNGELRETSNIEWNEKSDSKMDFESFDFLNKFESEDLDTILEDDVFIEELSQLKEAVDRKHNLEYLLEYQSTEDSFEKRRQALDKLVNANQKLVWKLVLRFQHYSTVSFDLYDMYQTGMIGLMKAAERFDVNKEYQFSTYATWWIMQSITRSIADYSTTIRIPVHMREKIVKYVKTQNEFVKKNGRVASQEELSKLLDFSLDEVNKLQIYKSIANLKSLDEPIGEDEGSFIGELIPDDTQQSPEEYVEETTLKRIIKDILKKRLTLREARILDSRFGLTDGEIHTLEEIGQAENVTRERIRQIEAKAIKKLCDFNKERLKDFYYA